MARPDILDRLSGALRKEGGPSSDFDLNPDTHLPPDRKLRPGAVLIGVCADTARLVLTKRSMHLKHHPGQVALPGGKVDPTDADAVAAALREAEEEVALPRGQVEVLGSLAAHETVTSFMITPVIGLFHGQPELRPEPGEVDEMFYVPLTHVTDPANFRIEGRVWQGRRRYYFTVPYGPYYIWGATAFILRGLAERMKP
jgi:8-oxo-dGTP pyrophosphatase MutT (NUDIX family)